MTMAEPSATEHHRDLTEERDWGIRFVIVAGLAAWVLASGLASVGYGGGRDSEPGWAVVVHVMPAVQGAVVGMIALAWIVTQWQRHDRRFVQRVRRLVVVTAWALVGIALVGTYAALLFVDRPPSSPPVVYFPLELVYISP